MAFFSELVIFLFCLLILMYVSRTHVYRASTKRLPPERIRYLPSGG